MKRALFWFRRDLRLKDNPALARALKECEEIIPVFVFDPGILTSPDVGARRVAFLLASLESLTKNLEHLGSGLLAETGKPEGVLAFLIKKYQVEALYWNGDLEPYALKRDEMIRQLCLQMGVRAVEVQDQCIQSPGHVLKADGSPYTVFTPYSKVWKQQPVPLLAPRPTKIKSPSGLKSDPLPSLQELGHHLTIPVPDAGEKAAHDLLKAYMQNGVASYESKRNIPVLDATSHLSPHLRFGTISPRSVHAAALSAKQSHLQAGKEIDVFISELIWRDFYKTILFYFPHVATGSFRPVYNDLEWENKKDLFQAWCEGQTGFPIVDAAMRQLNQTGWMHNRLRMIVASFLTKDLLIDWRQGERYFMQQLYDGDLAANNGGWQWAAGTGTDAQPYFRIFNPASQAEKFDPEGRFIEKYIPEINSMTYAAPVVDHAQQRLKALAMFKKVRG
jgi:deoxyribodipyrimidine photo-lyase